MNTNWYEEILLTAAVVLSVVIVWGNWNANEDLPIALCAGRDAFHGMIGQPNYWSYTCQGKVWVNQSWLSGLFFYLSHLALGELGPVLIKGFVPIACLPILYFRCRRIDVSRQASMVAMVIGALSVSPLFSIRPEILGIFYFVLLTTFLTAPISWGIFRQLGSLLVMLLWNNSHGTFLIGFVLIGLKAALPLLEYALRMIFKGFSSPGELGKNADSKALHDSISEETKPGARSCTKDFPDSPSYENEVVSETTLRGSETIFWLVTWVICIPLMFMATPFGIANLTMPFQQIGSELWTQVLPNWAPLIRIKGLTDLNIYHGNRGLPFLLVLILLCGMVVSAAIIAGPRKLVGRVLRQSSSTCGDLLMEAVISLSLVALTFRWGRTATIAGLVMIPFIAWVLHLWTGFFVKFLENKGWIVEALRGWGRVGLALLLLAFVTLVLFERTLPPYFPGNPLMPDCSVVRRLNGMYWTFENLTEFMKINRIGGRLYCNGELSSHFLFRVPGVHVWLDGRAQSFYTEDVWMNYQTVAGVDPQDDNSLREAFGLLDHYAVDTVVLWHGPEGLVRSLLSDKKLATDICGCLRNCIREKPFGTH